MKEPLQLLLERITDVILYTVAGNQVTSKIDVDMADEVTVIDTCCEE